MQHRTVRTVVEGDVSERHGARSAGQRARVGLFDHLRRLVEQREASLGAGQVRLQGGRLPGHGFQRVIELREITHQQEQRPQGEGAGLDLADPDEQHRSHPQGGGQSDHHAVLALDERQTNPRSHAFGGAAYEAVLLPFLSDESLDDAQAAQHFLDDPQSGLFEGLHLVRAAAKSAPIASPKHEDDGRNPHRNQRQLPGGCQRHIEHPRHHEGRADQGNDAVDRNRLNGGRVVLHAVEGLGGTPRIVKQER